VSSLRYASAAAAAVEEAAAAVAAAASAAEEAAAAQRRAQEAQRRAAHGGADGVTSFRSFGLSFADSARGSPVGKAASGASSASAQSSPASTPTVDEDLRPARTVDEQARMVWEDLNETEKRCLVSDCKGLLGKASDPSDRTAVLDELGLWGFAGRRLQTHMFEFLRERLRPPAEMSEYERAQLALSRATLSIKLEEHEVERREQRLREEKRAEDAGLSSVVALGKAIPSIAGQEELLSVLRGSKSGPRRRTLELSGVKVEVDMPGMDAKTVGETLADIKRALRKPEVLAALKRLGLRTRLTNHSICGILHATFDERLHAERFVCEKDFWIGLDAAEVNDRALERYYLLDGEKELGAERTVDIDLAPQKGGKSLVVPRMSETNLLLVRSVPAKSGGARKGGVDGGRTPVHPYPYAKEDYQLDPELAGFRSSLLQMGIAMTFCLNVDFLEPLARVGRVFSDLVSTAVGEGDVGHPLHFLVGLASKHFVEIWRRMLAAFELRVRDKYREAATVAVRHEMFRNEAVRLDIYSRTEENGHRNMVTEARDWAFGTGFGGEAEAVPYLLEQIRMEVERARVIGLKKIELGAFEVGGCLSLADRDGSASVRLGGRSLSDLEEGGGPWVLAGAAHWRRSGGGGGRRRLGGSGGVGGDATEQQLFDVTPNSRRATYKKAVSALRVASGAARCLAFCSHARCPEVADGDWRECCSVGVHSLVPLSDPSVGVMASLAERQGCRLAGLHQERMRTKQQAESYASGLWTLASVWLERDPEHFGNTSGAAHVTLGQLGPDVHSRLLRLWEEASVGRYALLVELVAEVLEDESLETVVALLRRLGCRVAAWARASSGTSTPSSRPRRKARRCWRRSARGSPSCGGRSSRGARRPSRSGRRAGSRRWFGWSRWSRCWTSRRAAASRCSSTTSGCFAPSSARSGSTSTTRRWSSRGTRSSVGRASFCTTRMFVLSLR
jgi:hypothetical protein